MPVTLITGPHQSGKSRRLWERLRAEPPGAAVLVRPTAGLAHDLIRQVHAWGGPGLLPPVWSFAELVERCVAAGDEVPRPFASGLAVHALRAWVPSHLRGPWAPLARYRATGRELAELCRRLDDHGVTARDVELAVRMLHDRGDRVLGEALIEAQAARTHLDLLAAKRGAAPAGARLRHLAAAGAAPAVAAIYIDDFQTFNPAELALLGALGQQRTLVIAAVADARLGPAGSPTSWKTGGRAHPRRSTATVTATRSMPVVPSPRGCGAAARRRARACWWCGWPMRRHWRWPTPCARPRCR